MTFSKLDSSITESSLWSEDLHVRIVFLSFLARKDETGFVSGARSGLIRVCNVTAEQFDDAILKLSSPDIESKTPDFEGRRIAKIDGGYVVLNADKYRLPEETKKENHRLYMQKWREEKESVKSREITENHNHSPSVSVSESISSSEEKSEEKRNKIVPPKIEWVVEYCNERKNNVIPQQFFDFYETKAWFVGKNKIKDWQACVRTWEKNNQNNPTVKKDKPKTSSNWTY
jgi:hypothetical protein